MIHDHQVERSRHNQSRISVDAPLLAAKLSIPPWRPLVARPRLIEQLDQLAERRLGLVAAPAGYGKTTLLVEWAHRRRQPVAWLSLDERDNELGRFLRYLVAAWAAIEPDLRQGPLGVLAASLMPLADNILSIFVNEAAARHKPVVFVLDDYHLISEPTVHDTLAFVIDHLPPQMHLVLISRSEPPLPLARWRARAELVELRADALRFTTVEAAQFFAQVAGMELAADVAATLAERTEGWVVGLQLAALSAQGQDDLRGVIETVSGKDRYIVDYLAGEVLSLQPELTRGFLLQTAILDRLCGPLCEVVTGHHNSQQMLEELERSNLFLVPLDNQRQWYRYHQLFAEFLGLQNEQRSVEDAATLHRRASAWYADNGFPDEAFHHAIAGKDFEKAAQVVEANISLKLAYGQHRVAAAWLQELPAELFATRPLLGLHRALFLLLGGQPGSCVECLEEIERRLGADAAEVADVRAHLARVAGARAIVACSQNDLLSAIAYAGRALQDLPEGDLFFRFAANIALGDTYRRGSQWASAVEPYKAALRIARLAPVPFIAIHPLSALGDLYVMRGHLRRAVECRREALDLIADQANWAGIALPLMGWAHIRMGELCYEWNDLEAAQEHLSKGLERAELGGETQALVFGYLALCQTLLAQGDFERANAQFRRAKPLVEGAEMPEWTNLLRHCQVQLWLKRGDIRSAVDWVEETNFGVDDETSYRYEIVRLAMARVLIAQGELKADAIALDRALVLLNRLLQTSEAVGRMTVAIEALALQALAFWTRGDLAPALGVLERALRLAEPEGYVRLFVSLGATMAALLQEARSRGVAANYVITLLSAFDPHLPARSCVSRPPLDPLSSREREVLRLVAAGLSNNEIATQLIIATGTVKRHVATIYEKLGVNSRTQAVARARELHLLQE